MTDEYDEQEWRNAGCPSMGTALRVMREETAARESAERALQVVEQQRDSLGTDLTATLRTLADVRVLLGGDVKVAREELATERAARLDAERRLSRFKDLDARWQCGCLFRDCREHGAFHFDSDEERAWARGRSALGGALRDGAAAVERLKDAERQRDEYHVEADDLREKLERVTDAKFSEGWVAELQTATRENRELKARLAECEAGPAAMRLCLESLTAETHDVYSPEGDPIGESFALCLECACSPHDADCKIGAALQSDAGAALLAAHREEVERLRRGIATLEAEAEQARVELRTVGAERAAARGESDAARAEVAALQKRLDKLSKLYDDVGGEHDHECARLRGEVAERTAERDAARVELERERAKFRGQECRASAAWDMVRTGSPVEDAAWRLAAAIDAQSTWSTSVSAATRAVVDAVREVEKARDGMSFGAMARRYDAETAETLAKAEAERDAEKARATRLEAALAPFAERAASYDSNWSDTRALVTLTTGPLGALTVGHLRAARAALAPPRPAALRSLPREEFDRLAGLSTDDIREAIARGEAERAVAEGRRIVHTCPRCGYAVKDGEDCAGCEVPIAAHGSGSADSILSGDRLPDEREPCDGEGPPAPEPAEPELVGDVRALLPRLREYVEPCGGSEHEQREAADLCAEVDAALARLPALVTEAEKHRAALAKIDAIRNSIIGRQGVNWSQHIYPLVAALDEAGFGGEGYDVARPKAAAEVAALQREVAEAEERGREEGRQAERAAVVAWLRGPHPCHVMPHVYARKVENGEHEGAARGGGR